MTLWLSDAEVADATHRRQPASQAKILVVVGSSPISHPTGTRIESTT